MRREGDERGTREENGEWKGRVTGTQSA